MTDNNSEMEVNYGFVEQESDDKDESVTKAPYVRNTDKAIDYRYTGLILIVFGFVGTLLVVLMFFGIIPSFFGMHSFSYCILFALLLLFWVMGIMSVKSAGGFEIKAKSDNLLEKRVLDFIRDEVSADVLDSECGIEEGDMPEIMFFKRTDHLKQMISKKFVNIDPDFLDDLIDGKLYDMIYGEKSE